MQSDTNLDQSPSGGGPKPTSHEDWLFGYAPRRLLLEKLFGPKSKRVKIDLEKGLSAAQLADLADKGRSTAKGDIAAMEALGLVRRVRIGKRDRFLPLADTHLARSVCLVLESVEQAGRT